MNGSVAFRVDGLPVPQGSAKWVVSASTGRPIPKTNPKMIDWRAYIAFAAKEAWGAEPPTGDPVRVQLHFSFPRPKGHFRTGRNADVLRDGAPTEMAKKPDLDKLTRAALDAMTHIVYADDCQVVGIIATKKYSEKPGLFVLVEQGGMEHDNALGN